MWEQQLRRSKGPATGDRERSGAPLSVACLVHAGYGTYPEGVTQSATSHPGGTQPSRARVAVSGVERKPWTTMVALGAQEDTVPHAVTGRSRSARHEF